jgi:hypothetical protein
MINIQSVKNKIKTIFKKKCKEKTKKLLKKIKLRKNSDY